MATCEKEDKAAASDALFLDKQVVSHTIILFCVYHELFFCRAILFFKLRPSVKRKSGFHTWLLGHMTPLKRQRL